MLFTTKDLAKASTSFESRFRLAYLSANFEPTIVYAANSKFLLASLYRGMPVKRHCIGCATTGRHVLELVSRFMPNIITLVDDLPDCSTPEVIDQAKKFNPAIRSVAIVTNLDSFCGIPNCPIVLAEGDMLIHPEIMNLATMAIISNTSYLSPLILERLKELDQPAPKVYPGTITLTPREHQLLEAYALGMSNKETAKKLGLSVRSVQTYSGNLLQKLGTSSRQKALRKAISIGLAEFSQLFN